MLFASGFMSLCASEALPKRPYATELSADIDLQKPMARDRRSCMGPTFSNQTAANMTGCMAFWSKSRAIFPKAASPATPEFVEHEPQPSAATLGPMKDTEKQACESKDENLKYC